MAELSPRDFLELVKKSGLIERTELKNSLAELNQLAGGEPVKLRTIADHLVDRGLLTGWHRDKLLEGKHKGFFLGHYRLLHLLGAGGMSTVYLAEHKLSRHRRAIKVLPRSRVDDKSYLDRFYREGRAAAALNHPNIVRIYDLANSGETHYMVMEYVEGVDLQEMVLKNGPLPVEKTLSFLKQAATGLKHAHDLGIVHRDVKPSNLLATAEGRLKVLDLGLALMNEGGESLTILHNDRVMGTADYLSPEQAINSHEVDPRADIYSLGCTVHFLLTGQPPFPEGSIAQRIAMHQSREPPSILSINPMCPEELADLVLRMMRKKKEERIQGCGDLLKELREFSAKLRGSRKVDSRKTDLALVGIEIASPSPHGSTITQSHRSETAAGAFGMGGTPSESKSAAGKRGSARTPPAKTLPDAKGVSGTGTHGTERPVKIPNLEKYDSGLSAVSMPNAPLVKTPQRSIGTVSTPTARKSFWVAAIVVALMFLCLLAVLSIALKVV